MSTVQFDSHALSTLRYIRNSMEAAASVAVPGSAGIMMGTVGIAASACTFATSLAEHWFAIWLIAAAVAAVGGAVLLLRPVSLRGVSLRGAPLQKFAVCLCPGLVAGAVLTCVLVLAHQFDLIAGTWLLLYGCALASASVPTTRMLLLMGALFGVSGSIAFFLPHPLQMLALGAGFGGIHLGFGIWMVSDGRKK